MESHDDAHDPRFGRRYDATRRGPVGQFPIPAGSRLRAVECFHCRKTLGVSTWDYLNGFLVGCPHCGGLHGKPWSIPRNLGAGLIFNALGFFFTLRPRWAVAAILIFVSVGWALTSLAGQYEHIDAFMIAAVGTIVFGPMLANAVLLVRHQMHLDKAPPTDSGNPGG